MPLNKDRLIIDLKNAFLGGAVDSVEIDPSPIELSPTDSMNEESIDDFLLQINNLANAIENFVKSGTVNTSVNTVIAGAVPASPPTAPVGKGTGTGNII